LHDPHDDEKLDGEKFERDLMMAREVVVGGFVKNKEAPEGEEGGKEEEEAEDMPQQGRRRCGDPREGKENIEERKERGGVDELPGKS
jgi:hypothetical protein